MFHYSSLYFYTLLIKNQREETQDHKQKINTYKEEIQMSVEKNTDVLRYFSLVSLAVTWYGYKFIIKITIHYNCPAIFSFYFIIFKLFCNKLNWGLTFQENVN
jgi:hypothetical protein